MEFPEVKQPYPTYHQMVETGIEQLYEPTTCQECGAMATRLVCVMEVNRQVFACLFCEACYRAHARIR